MQRTSIMDVVCHDNYKLKVKLDCPQVSRIDKLVIYINGSGVNTYDNRRKSGKLDFSYYDLFVQEFEKLNIAFCRYNTRGVKINDCPPLYAEVNSEEYKTYLPHNSIRDIESIVHHLRNFPELKDTKIILLGWSEGASIAPLVALNNNVNIHSLMLAGYSNSNIRELLDWQLSGGSSMVTMCKCFDYDNKGYVTREDYISNRYKVRKKLFPFVSFKNLDKNRDGIITEEDFKLRLDKYKKKVLTAIESGDDKWLEKHYPVRLTSMWFHEHFKLSPNSEVLPRLNLPIHIFHGTHDASCPVKGVEDIQEKFKKLGKNNLITHIFDKHDHDLNYIMYPMYGIVSDGLKCIFETCKKGL